MTTVLQLEPRDINKEKNFLSDRTPEEDVYDGIIHVLQKKLIGKILGDDGFSAAEIKSELITSIEGISNEALHQKIQQQQRDLPLWNENGNIRDFTYKNQLTLLSFLSPDHRRANSIEATDFSLSPEIIQEVKIRVEESLSWRPTLELLETQLGDLPVSVLSTAKKGHNIATDFPKNLDIAYNWVHNSVGTPETTLEWEKFPTLFFLMFLERRVAALLEGLFTSSSLIALVESKKQKASSNNIELLDTIIKYLKVNVAYGQKWNQELFEWCEVSRDLAHQREIDQEQTRLLLEQIDTLLQDSGNLKVFMDIWRDIWAMKDKVLEQESTYGNWGWQHEQSAHWVNFHNIHGLIEIYTKYNK